MRPTSIWLAAKPAFTKGPLSNSTKLILKGAFVAMPEAAKRVSTSWSWSPTLRTVPAGIFEAAVVTPATPPIRPHEPAARTETRAAKPARHDRRRDTETDIVSGTPQ